MKVVIIGSDSFLASYLISQMEIVHDLLLIGRNTDPKFDFPTHNVDTLIDALIESEAVIYCAGAGIQPGNQDDDELIWNLNCRQPLELIQVLNERNYSGQLITFGSYFELGMGEYDVPQQEETLLKHTNAFPNIYCEAKNRFSRSIDFQNSFSHLHFMLSNIYGAGENPKRLFPYLKEQADNNQQINVTSGQQVRQFTYVEDVAKFIVRVLENPTSGIFNLTNPKTTKVEEAISALLGTYDNDKTSLLRRSNERYDERMEFLALDMSKTEDAFGPFAFTDLTDGVTSYFTNAK